jgi:hypothetical protein
MNFALLSFIITILIIMCFIMFIIIMYYISPPMIKSFKYLLNVLFNFDNLDINYQYLILILLLSISYIILFSNRINNKKTKDINIHTLMLSMFKIIIIIINVCSFTIFFSYFS